MATLVDVHRLLLPPPFAPNRVSLVTNPSSAITLSFHAVLLPLATQPPFMLPHCLSPRSRLLFPTCRPRVLNLTSTIMCPSFSLVQMLAGAANQSDDEEEEEAEGSDYDEWAESDVDD